MEVRSQKTPQTQSSDALAQYAHTDTAQANQYSAFPNRAGDDSDMNTNGLQKISQLEQKLPAYQSHQCLVRETPLVHPLADRQDKTHEKAQSEVQKNMR